MIKTLSPIIAIGFAMLQAESIRFDKSEAGTLPPLWTVAMTHRGGPPKWEVGKDGELKVFAQVSADPTAGRFPLAIYDKVSLKDGTLSVKFKTISGKIDQAAGLVWRYRDPANYYIVRANALENNVVLYKVENGERVSLAPRNAPSRSYGVKHPVPKQVWSKLSVEFSGKLFTVRFNDEKLFDVEDSTFDVAGKVGLWTKADSVTYFDDFRISAWKKQ